MDFARKQMEKYGWSEGKGLGKNEDGISKAIKPTLKFDNAGVGHEIGKDFTNHWWENVYNNASKNIQVNKKKNDIKINLVNGESVEITTKDYSVKDFKKKNNNMEYGTFLKTCRLTEDGVVNYEDVVAPEQSSCFKTATLTDEELFAVCGGRTAHKGARHGLKLSGKLSRIEKQEKLLLKQMQRVSITDEEGAKVEKKLKKLSKNKSQMEIEKDDSLLEESLSKKKKRKKKRKSVSFSETVVVYPTSELDTSTEDIESNEPPAYQNNNDRVVEDNNTQDEGIEQDCDMNTEGLGQESFEEVQASKKVKKKKKKRSTFLSDLLDVDKSIIDKYDGLILIDQYKRKHDDDADSFYNMKRCEELNPGSLRRKRKKKSEKAINSIAESLDQVCKISDTE